MNVVVLGGAGDVGSRAVEDLAVSPGVELVTIADRDIGAARALAERLPRHGAPVRVRFVDADDHELLVEVLRGHDVAASALGPFHRFETKLVRAALDASVDYASICDEWQPAQAVLDGFDAEARSRGRTVVTGIGASPGLTNVGLRWLREQMDVLHRADVYCLVPLNAGGGEAALRHGLFIMTGEVAVWREGRQLLVPACSESRVVEFPEFGPVTVWNMGHSEPVTVPRFLDGIDEVSFFMGFGRGSKPLVLASRLGWLSRPRSVDAAVRLMGRLERAARSQGPAPGALRIDAWGEKDGNPVHRTLCGVSGMRDATGLALSVGSQMIARRELTTTRGGAYAPEGCLAVETFFSGMKARGVRFFEDVAMTTPLRVPA